MKQAEKGKVYLVGAGPGDPDLLTIRAASLMQTADCVFHDDLVAPEILKLAHKDASVENVGKRCGNKTITQEQINQLLIEKAQSGYSVVRLKTGDPMLFGRAGEEIEALQAVAVAFEVVPGITAGFAASAMLHVSLTDRRLASKVIFLTAHRAKSGEEVRFGPLPSDATLVIYMPGSDYSRLAKQLADAGIKPKTPCMIVSGVSTPQEQMLRTSVHELAHVSPLPAPCVVLVGEALG
jgi:uroporphyrin-III C-methyltransferase